jgi:hypothetical protein
MTPIQGCPVPDCAAPPPTQTWVDSWEDGCPRFECRACGTKWSWHLSHEACPEAP